MSATIATQLVANLGAEEGGDWRSHHEHRAVASATHLWGLLFEPPTQLLDLTRTAPTPWPDALGPEPTTAAFAWLGDTAAWLANDEAQSLARNAGVALEAPSSELIAGIHDKAHAIRAARSLGYEPRCLTDLLEVFDPEALRRPETFLGELARALDRWPDWTAGDFTLKPRQGSSGRGRVGGTARALSGDELGRALPRLADRGGAVLEPWLQRTVDLSAVLHVARPAVGDEPGITLLGALEQWMTPSGVHLGHLGEIDSRGRVFSGSPHEEAVREAAVALGADAREHGYFGPLGVDAFAFRMTPDGERDAREVLRPVVELNARFTMGIVTVGVVRRALRTIAGAVGIEPGDRRGFLLAVDLPRGCASWSEFCRDLPQPHCCLPLGAEGLAAQPALVVAPSLDPLRQRLRRA